MLILFLDDNEARLRWARRELGPGNCLLTCSTVKECIRLLDYEKGRAKRARAAGKVVESGFDVVYLDHDLEGEVFVDMFREDCGSEVVRWIVANRPPVRRFVVHSLNAPAANTMVQDLKAARYQAEYINFMRLVEGRAA